MPEPGPYLISTRRFWSLRTPSAVATAGRDSPNASATSEGAAVNTFHLLEYAAWAISILIGAWMLYDLIKTNATHSEDMLMSSREGEIEDELIIDPTHRGAK